MENNCHIMVSKVIYICFTPINFKILKNEKKWIVIETTSAVCPTLLRSSYQKYIFKGSEVYETIYTDFHSQGSIPG